MEQRSSDQGNKRRKSNKDGNCVSHSPRQECHKTKPAARARAKPRGMEKAPGWRGKEATLTSPSHGTAEGRGQESGKAAEEDGSNPGHGQGRTE